MDFGIYYFFRLRRFASLNNYHVMKSRDAENNTTVYIRLVIDAVQRQKKRFTRRIVYHYWQQ